MTEHTEQALLIMWAKRNESRWPELKWLSSSLNGIYIPGPRAIVNRIVNYMKSEGGFKKGIPDLSLPVARHGYHGLFIEMKRNDGGVVSKEQEEFMAFAADNNYLDKVCFGFDDARDTLEWYLEGRRTVIRKEHK